MSVLYNKFQIPHFPMPPGTHASKTFHNPNSFGVVTNLGQPHLQIIRCWGRIMFDCTHQILNAIQCNNYTCKTFTNTLRCSTIHL